jgi:GNAT superfamily N-acetyltransferase
VADLVTIELPDGLTARPATRGDVPAINDLVAACELADDGSVETDEEDLVTGFGRVGFDPSEDTTIVFDGELLVGWAEVYRGRAEVQVLPTHRGRGLGAALLAWTEARALALGSAELGQTVTVADTHGGELFQAAGYRPKWDSWILRIDLGEPTRVTHATALPEGVHIRPYDPVRDERDSHRVWEEAMSTLRGRTPEPFDVWASQTIAYPSFAPGLSRVAIDRGELVGTLLAYDVPDADEVWIGQVATAASHRRRGIATAMLREAFAAARDAGRARCGLSTDSETGARALYERSGMRVVRTYVRYAKKLT